jgi:peptidoglycan/LPS O-acetylase OafA/YrhL
MRWERTLKVVLVVVGLIFSAGVYPVAKSLWQQDQSMYVFDMMLSLYVALGIFLLIAARNPSANRSLIAFTAWSCFAHGAVMSVTSFSKGGYRGDIWGVPVLVVIGAALIVLAPAKQSGERASAAPGEN